MTTATLYILTGALVLIFLVPFLWLRYGRNQETKEIHRARYVAWLAGKSPSAIAYKILIFLLLLAIIAHVLVTSGKIGK
jgi:hypothetical protein